ncbi:hypothetical protein HIM_02360 [Hirsutella minnesotensis 3608]|nr:hypothetical protein HIM_02360 [Hirsutella minnesotensis 3608]
MAELIGTTVGVIGFIGQLFDGCVKAYGYFLTASHLDADSQRLMCKVRIEEMRLVVWGREWGVAEGRLEAHLDSGRNPQLRALATQILKELHSTVTDFRKLQERYGLVEADGGRGSQGANGGDGSHGNNGHAESAADQGSKTSGSASGRGWRKEVSLRTKWVIADKDKFTNLLRDLKDFNDGLERLFPPSQLPSFQRAWTHRLLESAERDLTELSLLETASTGIYPQLETSAKLKRLRINLDSKPQSAFKPTFALKVARTALDIPQPCPPRRCRARHETHVRRMDDLARMMHSASERHPDLHSIDCVGYTDDAARSRYGLVYKAPAPSFDTLHALIAGPDLKTPDLNDRVRLARTLAVALWSLHSLDWLHKSLCSSNILFFPSALDSAASADTSSQQAPTTSKTPPPAPGPGAAPLVPDISRPYLSGFDASRPDLDTALSVAPRNPSIDDLHRHPAALRGGRPFCKALDVYSLGLVLLEIGMWKVLQTYYKPHYAADRWRDRVLLAVLVPGLASRVGRRYCSVVDMCLRVDEDLSSSEAGKLMETVVTTLEGICV